MVSRTKVNAPIAIGLALVAAVTTLSGDSARAAANQEIKERAVVLEKEQDGWFRATTKPAEPSRHSTTPTDPSLDTYRVILDVKAKTRKELEDYVQRNKTWATQLFAGSTERLDLHITLQRPVSIDTVARLAADIGLVVDHIKMRGVGPDGVRVTGQRGIVLQGEGPNVGFPTDADLQAGVSRLNQVPVTAGPPNARQSAQRPNIKYVGVIEMVGQLPAARYADLIKHADVYLADVTPTLAKRELEQGLGKKPSKVEVASDGVYWTLEDIGVAPQARP